MMIQSMSETCMIASAFLTRITFPDCFLKGQSRNRSWIAMLQRSSSRFEYDFLPGHRFDRQLIAQQMGHGFDRQFHGKNRLADQIVPATQSAFGPALEVTVARNINHRPGLVIRQLPKTLA